MNNVHKDTKDLVSVIIKMVTNISEGETVFYYGVKTTYLGNRSHALKHLHVRTICGPFERCFHERYLWRVHRSVIYFILKQEIVHFFCHGDQSHYQYINSTTRTKYIHDDGTGVKSIYF